VVIQDATVLTGTGERLDGADVLMRDGVIEAVGVDLEVPAGVRVIDGTGRWVTPGLIDNHSHLGVYPSPGVTAHADGNEMTNPNTAEVWAEHSIWPQDPGFIRALEAGVTSLALLPGSANLFGGRIATVRNVPGRGYQDMKFPDAPHGLEDGVWGEPEARLRTGQGQFAHDAWATSRATAPRGSRRSDTARLDETKRRWRDDGEDATTRIATCNSRRSPPSSSGEILVHNHCYRADEMLTMIDIARGVRLLHRLVPPRGRGVQGPRLPGGGRHLRQHVGGLVGLQARGVRRHPPERGAGGSRGACAIVHSDDGHGIQRLNQEAAKVLGASATMGTRDREGSGDRVDHAEPGAGAGHQ
jgi:imidazolonepropionase-like amidohydrolase